MARIDIKKIKAALLREFNHEEPKPETIAADDPLDSVLSQYFNSASHMPRELTLEAITRMLHLGHGARDIDSRRVKEILDRHGK